MRRFSSRTFTHLILLAVALLSFFVTARSQTLETRLNQQTDFIPHSASPVDQLIEVAQKFKIPMGVEWIEDSYASPPADAASSKQPGRTVRDLIEEIVRRSTEHQVEVEGSVLHVFAPSVVSSPLNFLNIRIVNFRVEDANIFDAEAQLRYMINLTLYPDLFRNGYGGGYGYPPDHVFTIPNITINARNLTIREILDRITESNGNSLWVVKLKSREFARRRPYWKGKPLDDYGSSPISSRWNFMPLSEIGDLANEQVVVDLIFDDLAPERRVIPVITRYGLSGDAGGATGMFTEGHSYYGYGLSVQKVNQEGVTLKVELTVKLPNELEKKFEETFTVTHEGVIELHPTQDIAIKAYFEPRN